MFLLTNTVQTAISVIPAVVFVLLYCVVSLCSSAHTHTLTPAIPLKPRHSHPVCTTTSLMFLLCGFLSGQPCLRDHLTLRFCQTLLWLGRCQLPSVRTQCCKTCGLNSRGSDRTTRRWESRGFNTHPDLLPLKRSLSGSQVSQH